MSGLLVVERYRLVEQVKERTCSVYKGKPSRWCLGADGVKQKEIGLGVRSAIEEARLAVVVIAYDGR